MRKWRWEITNLFFLRIRYNSVRNLSLLLRHLGIRRRYLRGLRLLSWGIKGILLLLRRRLRSWRELGIIGLKIIRNWRKIEVLRNFLIVLPKKVVSLNWARLLSKNFREKRKIKNQGQCDSTEVNLRAEEHHSMRETQHRQRLSFKML